MVAKDQLKSIVERIERLDAEIKDLNSDKSDIYKEAKSNGFDVKVLRKIIADRRKDKSELDEFETFYQLYAIALGMLPDFEPISETGTEHATRAPAQEFA